MGREWATCGIQGALWHLRSAPTDDSKLDALVNISLQFRTTNERPAGGHMMNGPIYVCGAEPGDVLQA